MNTHSFNVDLATKIGFQRAIILQHIYFWVQKNRANDKNKHEEKYWTYNSLAAFQEIFPYLSKDQISYALKKLVDEGYIIEGNYNKTQFDRTKWYALTNKGEKTFNKDFADSISENPKSIKENTKSISNNPQPIPDIEPDNKPYYNYIMSEVKRSDVPTEMMEYFDIAYSFYQLFFEHLKNRGVKTEQFVKQAKVKTWLDPVRLMISKKEAEIDDLRLIFAYLRSKNFWSETISSTAAIRKHLTKILKAAMKENNHSRPDETMKAYKEFQEKYG